MKHGCAEDPREYLAELKAAGQLWTPMNAARLVMGREVAEGIRADMGDHWLSVAIAAHLATARDTGEWSFAHATLEAWLAHQRDELDEFQYRKRLDDLAREGSATFLQ